MTNPLSYPPLGEALKSLLDTGFIAFCGAGVSIPPPTCSPSWWTLAEEILQSFFARVPEDYNLPKDMVIKDPDRRPEEVFENFAGMLDEKLNQVFEVLDVTRPNKVHRVLARMAKGGFLKGCFTTNFDIYFEKALKEEGVDFELLVENRDYDHFLKTAGSAKGAFKKFVLCKLHGTLERPDTIISVASAYKSAKGFSAPKGATFEFMLQSYPCLFLGYSGWDFDHRGYRRFWERVGPGVKRIVWSRFPGDPSGPDLEDIFRTCWKSFEFVQATLPEDLLRPILQNPPRGLSVDTLAGREDREKMMDFEKARQNRKIFFDRWARDLPEAHTLGLCITEARNFSERFRKFMKNLQETSRDSDALSLNQGDQMALLGEKLSRQEITLEEFQQKLSAMQVASQLHRVRKSYQAEVKRVIAENAFPGVTDNQVQIVAFVGFAASLSRYFDCPSTLSMAAERCLKIQELSEKNTEEARAEQLILNFSTTILHPEERLYKPFVSEMYREKKRYLQGELDYESFLKRLGDLLQEAMNHQSGMTIEVDRLMDKLVQITAGSPNNQVFQDQCEALAQTVVLGVGWMKKLFSSKPYTDLVMALGQERVPYPSGDGTPRGISQNHLDELDQFIRNLLKPVLERAEGADEKTKVLMEMAIQAVWVYLTQWLDPQGLQEYTKAWDSGDYPFRRSHPIICEYLKKKRLPWLDRAKELLEPRFLQRLCGDLVILSEMGDNPELCQEATLLSLSLTGGKITEVTPQAIPGSLAAFWEKRGDKEKALEYYHLCLDGMKLAFPPVWSDAIVYRTALLLYQKEDQIGALKVIGKYHPEFMGNPSSTHMPAREMTLALAEKIAKELGYLSAREAVETVI